MIEKSDTATHNLIESNRYLIERNHRELGSSLGDALERLARIEGYLRISPPPGRGSGQGDGDAKAA